MTDDRWRYLKRRYQGASRRRDPQVHEDLRVMGFDSAEDALRWFGQEFERVEANRIYGCGCCCNDFIAPFIGWLESASGHDLNEMVIARFGQMQNDEKRAVLASYHWFFDFCGGDVGREKARRLKEALSETEYFREERNANEAAREQAKRERVAAVERSRLEGLKEAHLAGFRAKEAEIARTMGEVGREIEGLQAEMARLDSERLKVLRRREREAELYDFERLSVGAQVEVLLVGTRPMAYYEGRLSMVLKECKVGQLSEDVIDQLLASSRSARPGSLPQVAEVHQVLRQRKSNH